MLPDSWWKLPSSMWLLWNPQDICYPAMSCTSWSHQLVGFSVNASTLYFVCEILIWHSLFHFLCNSLRRLKKHAFVHTCLGLIVMLVNRIPRLFGYEFLVCHLCCTFLTSCKVCECYSGTFLKGTPIFDWCVVRWRSKNTTKTHL